MLIRDPFLWLELSSWECWGRVDQKGRGRAWGEGGGVRGKEGGWVWGIIGAWERNEDACLFLLFSRWIVNDLNFCGNANLSRNTTDGIDYDFCPNHCDYQTPFWGQASSIVSKQNMRILRMINVKLPASPKISHFYWNLYKRRLYICFTRFIPPNTVKNWCKKQV